MSMGMQIVRQRALSAIIFTVLLTGGVWPPRVASAATYYVATTGSDANPGSQSQPFRTIDKGVSVLQAGDTLYLRGGTYNPGRFGQHASVPLPSGTSWSNAVTIAGYPGETVTLAGLRAGGAFLSESYIIFDRLVIDASAGQGGLFFCCGAHHIRFQNGELKDLPPDATAPNFITGNADAIEIINTKIHDGPYYAFYWGGTNSIFDGNEIYNMKGYAYHIFSSGSSSVGGNIIRNNIIHDNGFGPFDIPCSCFGGLLLSCGSNNQAYNNVIYGNFAGIQVDYRCTNCQVYNNTIYGNTAGGAAGVYIGTSVSGTIIKNNIIYANGQPGITNDGDAGAVISNNWTDSNGNPQFVNATASDFRLQSTSPAIDAGVTLSAVPTDVKGMARPQGTRYDIGAYEYQVSTVPAPNNLRATSVMP